MIIEQNYLPREKEEHIGFAQPLFKAKTHKLPTYIKLTAKLHLMLSWQENMFYTFVIASSRNRVSKLDGRRFLNVQQVFVGRISLIIGPVTISSQCDG